MSLNPFTERYKTIRNSDLLTIIDHPGDYQELAVEAALIELGNRKLADDQINEARASLNAMEEEKRAQQAKLNAFERRIKSAGATLVDSLNPKNEDPAATTRLINIISIFLAGLSCFQLLDYAGLLVGYGMGFYNFNIGNLPMWTPMVFLPLATILFWMRRRAGWVLISILFTHWFFSTLFSFIVQLDEFNTIPVLIYCVAIIIFGGVLLAILGEKIRRAFSVTGLSVAIAVGGMALLTTFQWRDLLW